LLRQVSKHLFSVLRKAANSVFEEVLRWKVWQDARLLGVNAEVQQKEDAEQAVVDCSLAVYLHRYQRAAIFRHFQPFREYAQPSLAGLDALPC
jgi:hypothetical protein